MLLPAQHPDVASAMYLYACAAGEAGDLPLKRELCARALQIYELHVSSQSLELVPVLVNLAAATVGDSPARRILLERALSIKEHHVGDAHPDLVRCFAKMSFSMVLSLHTGSLTCTSGKRCRRVRRCAGIYIQVQEAYVFQ